MAARLGALLIILILWSNAVVAGPWARDAGDVFLSFGATVEDARGAVMNGNGTPETVVSTYGEWGLGQRLTAGLDLSYGESSRIGSVFLRRTLTASDAPVQLALHAGLAHQDRDGQDSGALLRIGGSIGRGFGATAEQVGWMALSHEGGWTTLEAAAYLDRNGEVQIWQIEAVLGMRMSDRWTTLWALKAEDWSQSETVVTARPSLLYTIGEGTTVQAGLVAGLSNSDSLGLAFSLWRDF